MHAPTLARRTTGGRECAVDMFPWRCLVLLLWVEIAVGGATRRENRLLSRRKRYLTFPKGSNLVMTCSYVKALMKTVPKGINALGEMDVPFPLPFDTRWFKEYKRPHHRQKRELLSQLQSAIDAYGLNGNACVKRMICEAQQFIPSKGKSLVRDLLSSVFTFPDADEVADGFKDSCHNSTFADCAFPFLHLLAGSFSNN